MLPSHFIITPRSSNLNFNLQIMVIFFKIIIIFYNINTNVNSLMLAACASKITEAVHRAQSDIQDPQSS